MIVDLLIELAVFAVIFILFSIVMLIAIYWTHRW